MEKLLSSISSRLRFVVLAFAYLLVVGCGSSGPAYHPVSGKVVFTKDGSNAQFGSIEIRPESSPRVIARGKINKDGTFELNSQSRRGAIEGWHTVAIVQVVGSPRLGDVTHNHGLEVAEKYRDHRTTDLRIEVTAESDGLALEVDEKKSRK